MGGTSLGVKGSMVQPAGKIMRRWECVDSRSLGGCPDHALQASENHVGNIGLPDQTDCIPIKVDM